MRRFSLAVVAEALCPLILLVILVDAMSFVGWPWYAGRDAAIYATVARFWQEGFVPYRDIYDFKPPLIYAALRAGFALWDLHPESLRRIMLLMITAGALVLYVGLRRARALVAAPVAALGLMTLVVPDSGELVLQNTEPLLTAAAAAACGCAAAYARYRSRAWAVAAGAYVGVAALAKQPGVLFAAPVVAQLWLGAGGDGPAARWRVRAESVLLVAAGFTGVLAACAGYFLACGGLRALYDAVLVDGARYSGTQATDALTPLWWVHLARARGVRMFVDALTFGRFWPFVGAVLALVPLSVLVPSRWAVIAWAWLAAAYLACIVGPLGDMHYLVMAYPALALALGVVCELVVRASGTATGNERRLLAAAILLAGVLYAPRWWFDYRTLRQRGPAPAEAAEVIGGRIREAARPDDRLLVEGEPLSIYVYAGVRPVTRYTYWNAPNPEAFAAFENSLSQRPRFIVVTPQTAAQLRQAAAAPVTALERTVAADYELWFEHPAGTVYRRPERTGAATNATP